MRFAYLLIFLCVSLTGCKSADQMPAAQVPANIVQTAGADSMEADVRRIRAHVTTIGRELPTYRCRTLELDGFSIEGGELRACYAAVQLRKLTALYLGESGRAQEEFFFWDQELESALRIEARYTEPLSGVIAEETQERLYFVNGDLVRWLGAGNVVRDPRSAEARERATSRMSAAIKFAECAQDVRAARCSA